MSGHEEPAQPGSADGCRADRWQRMWGHRERLLKVARRRSMNMEDAEDAVHEAMVRAVERGNVDDARLGAWLTTVTVRLCVDRFRQVGRETEAHTRSVLAAPGSATVEEVVCDRAEARWLAHRSTDLPARQAEVLHLRAQGLDLAEIAQRTGLGHQAVRSLLARARRTLRATLAGTLAIAAWVWRGRPRAAHEGVQAVAMVSATVTLAMAGLALTGPSEAEAGEASAPRPRPSRPYEAAPPAGPISVSEVRRAPALYEPTPSALPAESGFGLGLPADEGTGALPVGAGPARSSPPSAVPSLPQGSPLPAVPTLPEAPDPVLPATPDVSAVIPPVVPTAPPGPLQPIEMDGARADIASGLPTTDAPLPQH